MSPQETSPVIVHAIQLAIAPVFLLTGIGAMLGVMANRLARIIDRARALDKMWVELDEAAHMAARAEFSYLERRRHLASWAINFCTGAALLVCLVIVTLFVEGTLRPGPQMARRRAVHRRDDRPDLRPHHLPARGVSGDPRGPLRDTQDHPLTCLGRGAAAGVAERFGTLEPRRAGRGERGNGAFGVASAAPGERQHRVANALPVHGAVRRRRDERIAAVAAPPAGRRRRAPAGRARRRRPSSPANQRWIDAEAPRATSAGSVTVQSARWSRTARAKSSARRSTKPSSMRSHAGESETPAACSPSSWRISVSVSASTIRLQRRMRDRRANPCASSAALERATGAPVRPQLRPLPQQAPQRRRCARRSCLPQRRRGGREVARVLAPGDEDAHAVAPFLALELGQEELRLAEAADAGAVHETARDQRRG